MFSFQPPLWQSPCFRILGNYSTKQPSLIKGTSLSHYFNLVFRGMLTALIQGGWRQYILQLYMIVLSVWRNSCASGKVHDLYIIAVSRSLQSQAFLVICWFLLPSVKTWFAPESEDKPVMLHHHDKVCTNVGIRQFIIYCIFECSWLKFGVFIDGSKTKKMQQQQQHSNGDTGRHSSVWVWKKKEHLYIHVTNN